MSGRYDNQLWRGKSFHEAYFCSSIHVVRLLKNLFYLLCISISEVTSKFVIILAFFHKLVLEDFGRALAFHKFFVFRNLALSGECLHLVTIMFPWLSKEKDSSSFCFLCISSPQGS